MSRARRHCHSLIVLLLLALGACVSAPVQEMSNARQAIAAAEAAGAKQHAPIELAEAHRLLDQAEARLQDKHFREARRAAVAAKTRAVAALEATSRSD